MLLTCVIQHISTYSTSKHRGDFSSGSKHMQRVKQRDGPQRFGTQAQAQCSDCSPIVPARPLRAYHHFPHHFPTIFPIEIALDWGVSASCAFYFRSLACISGHVRQSRWHSCCHCCCHLPADGKPLCSIPITLNP